MAVGRDRSVTSAHPPPVETGARFSPCRRWRYDLWRRWQGGPKVLWLLLNPSTADERVNDATVERCQRRSRALGAGSYHVCNVFGLCSTDPAALYRADDPVGPDNDTTIVARAREADRVICGWGNHGRLHDRGRRVLALLYDHGIQPYCLGVTRAGEPAHPLYLAYAVQPRPLLLPGDIGS